MFKLIEIETIFGKRVLFNPDKLINIEKGKLQAAYELHLQGGYSYGISEETLQIITNHVQELKKYNEKG